MRVRRKYNLSRIGIKYESVDIEVDADTIDEALRKLDYAWTELSNHILRQEQPPPTLTSLPPKDTPESKFETAKEGEQHKL